MQDREMMAGDSGNLWVLARVNESICAVNGDLVEAILLLDQQITRLPSSDDVHVGVISLRGGIIPVIDLRIIMGMKSSEQEMQEFDDMLDARMQDHVRWVDEFERCIEQDDEFKLAIDPHECAFGKWYDSYHSTSQSVAFHLAKIDEPHRKLHGTALRAFSKENGRCGTQAEEERNRAAKEYMPVVLALMKEAKTVLRNSSRKMVMVISRDGVQRGILVDEVLSAEPFVSMLESNRLADGMESPLVTHIAQRRNEPEQVLVLNEERLLNA